MMHSSALTQPKWQAASRWSHPRVEAGRGRGLRLEMQSLQTQLTNLSSEAARNKPKNCDLQMMTTTTASPLVANLRDADPCPQLAPLATPAQTKLTIQNRTRFRFTTVDFSFRVGLGSLTRVMLLRQHDGTSASVQKVKMLPKSCHGFSRFRVRQYDHTHLRPKRVAYTSQQL